MFGVCDPDFVARHAGDRRCNHEGAEFNAVRAVSNVCRREPVDAFDFDVRGAEDSSG